MKNLNGTNTYSATIPDFPEGDDTKQIADIEAAIQILLNNSVHLKALASSAFPSGMIAPYAGSAAPAGWLLCNGSAVSRTTYATLFAVIGTTYNTGGEAGTDFRLPDLRGKFPLGVSGSHALASTGGTETHALTVDELPPHTHALDSHLLTEGVAGAGAGGTTDGTSGTITETGSTGDGDAFSIMPPFLAVHYIIKT